MVNNDDIENAIAFMLPDKLESFPRRPQNVSNEIHVIMEYLTVEATYSALLSKQKVFTKFGLCFSYNQLNISSLYHES